ncbi:MAG: ABC transporter permease [Chloroflexi bacterium]|nr:ABC transporter permease [Chloroflexota bacterium]
MSDVNPESAQTSATLLEGPRVRQTTFGQDVWRRFRRNRLAVAGAMVVLLLVACALLARILAPYDPLLVQLEKQFSPPSAAHPFGTDVYGRDIFSRVLFGARISLLIGLIPSAISMLIGTIVGVLAGFQGGWLDTLLMRLSDVVMAFPSIILAMVVTYTLGASLFTLFIALSVVGWAGAARVVRAQTLSLKERDFVTAARAIGVTRSGTMFRHIVPNCLAPIIVLLTLGIPSAIMAEAGLSFLGVGAQPPTPSWGLMVNEAQQYVFSAPWASILPGVAILITVLAFNFVGDGLRDALDPYLKGKL